MGKGIAVRKKVRSASIHRKIWAPSDDCYSPPVDLTKLKINLTRAAEDSEASKAVCIKRAFLNVTLCEKFPA